MVTVYNLKNTDKVAGNKDKQSIILPNWIIRLQRVVPPDGTPSQLWAAGVLCYVTPQISLLCVPGSSERQKTLMTVTGLGLMVKPIEAE